MYSNAQCRSSGKIYDLTIYITLKELPCKWRLSTVCCDNCMFVGTMYNSEDTCKTMSLHVRRLNVSLPTHPSTHNVYKSQSPNSFSLAAFYILQNMRALFPPVPPLASPQPAPLQHGPSESTKRHWLHLTHTSIYVHETIY